MPITTRITSTHRGSHTSMRPRSSAPGAMPDVTVSSSTMVGTDAPAITHSTLFLVRHGERADQVSSDPWYSCRQPRRRDPPLTAHGLSQAHQAAACLRRDRIVCNVVYSSPLTRCLQTAAALAAALNVGVVVVYSLAKSCAYFRKSRATGHIPEVADADEVANILRAVDVKVRLVRYEQDDGLSCLQTLERLAGLSIRAAKELDSFVHPQTVVSGHCESQLEMARASGTRRIAVPYCGQATFLLEHAASRVVSWTMTESPAAHRDRFAGLDVPSGDALQEEVQRVA